MMLCEFNKLTELNIKEGEDYYPAYKLVEEAYMKCKEDKYEFCYNLKWDYLSFKNNQNLRDLDENYKLWLFMSIIGYRYEKVLNYDKK